MTNSHTVDKYGYPLILGYVVNEEVYVVQTADSHTDYLNILASECSCEFVATHVRMSACPHKRINP
jgi:hypothetical protein